jgi:dienelactone hydrolase
MTFQRAFLGVVLVAAGCTERTSGREPATPPDAAAETADAAVDGGGGGDAGEPHDAGPPDSHIPDSSPLDSGRPDAGRRDGGPPDANLSDAAPIDSSLSDAAPRDTGVVDSSVLDSSVRDTGLPADGGADAGRFPSAQCSQLVVTGQATGTNGATWRYISTDNGVAYDLSGIILEPTTGTAPFPAVVVSHGKGGSATGYSRNAGQKFRAQGALVIATNYTHAQVPSGLPMGGNGGTSAENMLRAAKVLALLQCLPNADLTRVAAHGHSQGAFITGQLVGTWPDVFAVASHSAGGVSETGSVNDNVPTTTEAAARNITAPYQLHHGNMDEIVDLSVGQNMNAILTETGVAHEMHIYPDAGHAYVSLDEVVFSRVMAWYTEHGFF